MADTSGHVVTVVLARDEELHIERAVKSALPLGPVYVIDSGSVDSTVDLAAAAGALVMTHEWQGFGQQRNWALRELPQFDWLLFLDADEYLTIDLVREIQAIVTCGGDDAYYIPRRNYFLGRELRYAGRYPDWQLRLFKRGSAKFEERLVHERAVTRGVTGRLRHGIRHENLRGIEHFIARHAAYAKLEAEQIVHSRQEGTPKWTWFFGNHFQKRRALKELIWFRLPFRALVSVVWLLIVKRGFRDGRAGVTYAALLGAYEIMIDAFVAELNQQSSL